MLFLFSFLKMGGGGGGEGIEVIREKTSRYPLISGSGVAGVQFHLDYNNIPSMFLITFCHCVKTHTDIHNYKGLVLWELTIQCTNPIKPLWYIWCDTMNRALHLQNTSIKWAKTEFFSLIWAQKNFNTPLQNVNRYMYNWAHAVFCFLMCTHNLTQSCSWPHLANDPGP